MFLLALLIIPTGLITFGLLTNKIVFTPACRGVVTSICIAGDCFFFLLPFRKVEKADISELEKFSSGFKTPDLSGKMIQGEVVENMDLQNACLKEVEGKDVIIRNSRLRSSIMNFSNFTSAKFRNVRMRMAQLKGANLSFAKFIRTRMKDANLEFANLKGAFFRSSNLRGVCLKMANLHKAIFKNVNLENANLMFADLRGARMAEVTLQGANLSGAKFNENTVLPFSKKEALDRDMIFVA